MLRTQSAFLRYRWGWTWYVVPLALVVTAGLAGAAGPTPTPTAVSVPNALSATLRGLRSELPCTGPIDSSLGCKSANMITTSTILSGRPGTQYDVTLRFRGVVEPKTYTGGTADGSWYVGGSPADDGFNSYQLTIQNPPQTYFLNAGASFVFHCSAIDYTRTVRVAAGSIISLNADPGDGVEVRNIDTSGAPIVIPGIPPAPRAFEGQFVEMDVVSVTPVP